MKNTKKLIATIMMSLVLAMGAVVLVSSAAPAQVQAATTKDKLNTKITKVLKAAKVTVTAEDTAETKEANLKKVFQYMRKNYKYANCTKHPNYIPPTKGSDWTDAYALETLNKKSGDCYHFAAAFASVAQRVTGYNTRVVTGTCKGFDAKRKNAQGHAWAEVKIGSKWYIFDVNLDKYGKDTNGKTVKALTYYKVLRTQKATKKLYNNYKKTLTFNVKM